MFEFLDERMRDALMEQVRDNPTMVFTLGRAMYQYYPEDVEQIATAHIRARAARARNRSAYRRIAEDIVTLASMGAMHGAMSLLEELVARYPRKKAFLEELDDAEHDLLAWTMLL